MMLSHDIAGKFSLKIMYGCYYLLSYRVTENKLKMYIKSLLSLYDK